MTPLTNYVGPPLNLALPNLIFCSAPSFQFKILNFNNLVKNFTLPCVLSSLKLSSTYPHPFPHILKNYQSLPYDVGIPTTIMYSPIIYLFKVNNRNTRKRCKIRSKLTTKYQNEVSDIVLVILLLTSNICYTFFQCFYC